MLIRKKPPRSHALGEPLRHQNHPLPVTRRDFIAAGFLSGPAMVIGPAWLGGLLKARGASAALSPDIQALLASVPGLATRFYQSLALTLSQRLRELTVSLPPLIVEDVPQVTRFATERSGRPGSANLPPSLVDAVEAFKTAMLETDRGLKDRKLADDAAQSRVGQACNSLETALREHIQRDETAVLGHSPDSL